MKISARHKEILLLSSKGLTGEAIAIELGISINTVKYHKKKIYNALNVSSINEALTILLKDMENDYPKV